MTKKVLVWIPAPPGANWAGEGIAQTIGHWLDHINNANVNFIFLVSDGIADSIRRYIPDDSGHEVYVFGYRIKPHVKSKKKTIIREYEVDNQVSFLSYVYSYIEKYFGKLDLKNLFSLGGYAFKLKIMTYFVNKRIFFKNIDLVWVPIPAIAFSEQFDGNVVYSFWDPFVMEYSDFDQNIRSLYALKFRRMFSRSKRNIRIITQSHANKKYLNSVIGVEEKVINIVRLGCPDYKKLLYNNGLDYKEIAGLKSDELLKLWPRAKSYPKPVGKKGLIGTLNEISKEIVNHSSFFRLVYNLEQNSKIIMISTQDRPYKGLDLVFDIIARLKSRYSDYPIHVITTAKIPARVKQQHPELFESIIELTRLPNVNHAFCVAMSDIVLHPSFVEGGLGSYSMFEAASVNVASLTNIGRSTAELKRWVGDAIDIAFQDFTDIDTCASRIDAILRDDVVGAEIVSAVKDAWYSWDQSTKQLVSVFE